ncbi:uclacyanin-3-like [Salvia miltiorrhiza]|uniref:uclacyanin-3-like n=1 Tax=Salvia miltiorrhiza TaxID=226208 RepID=UPI0025ACBFBE|nr:uclacyanin-3-like [Salvia miltiorrhiza]
MSSKLMKTFLRLGVMAAVLMEMAAAANYTVGSPDGGWDQSTDLQTWASAIKFEEGDNLIFGYTTNHDVTEVSKPDFDSCTASSPLQPPHTGGAAVIPLTSAGSRYFICGTGGHCISGMKLAITTLAAASSPPPPASAAAPPPSTTPAVPSPPPSKTTAPSPPPKPSKVTPPPPAVPAPAPPPSGSALPPPPPPPSAAAKFDVMGSLTGLIMMVWLIIV